MNIIDITSSDTSKWDSFVKENYPPVGAFMQSWAWGIFQKDLGRTIYRYGIIENEKLIAIFTMIELKLFFNLSYGYVPRGPVILKGLNPEKIALIFETIRKWSLEKFSHFIFLRLGPPISFSDKFLQKGFYFPPYYIQPRYNTVIDLNKNEEGIISSFHPSTRSNVKRAERRGVTVIIKDNIDSSDYEIFKEMMKDTIERNNGKNAYPNDDYFNYLFKEIPYSAFYGYCDGKPASVHFVIFFGKTATYIYGASHTAYLSSKVDTYLHWTAIKEAKKRGYEYYDIGGIDIKRWPSLTKYKRQFMGQEIEYMGNIDIPFNLIFYHIYSFIKHIKTWLAEVATRK